MANLLYVTKDVLAKLRQHPAYQFWSAIFYNQPIRLTPLEERSFHPRTVPIKENHIYLTIDMKFAYCRDNMFSFLYETQDLSFRLQAADGILRTLDNKQFTAIIGPIGVSSSTSDVELVNPDTTYHPLFDCGYFCRSGGATAPPSPILSPARARGTKAVEPAPQGTPVKAAAAASAPAEPVNNATGQVLGRFPKRLCDEIVDFRNTSKKSYAYLAERFGLNTRDIKEICTFYKDQAQAGAAPAVRETLRAVPQNVQDEIVRMKQVSKKSYTYLAKKFDLPIESIQEICSLHLKRPRQRPLDG